MSRAARISIDDDANEVFVSAVSAWEIATKIRLGRLPFATLLAEDMTGHVAAQGFREMTMTLRHGQRAGSLPEIHKDPFDRMLIAQAEIEGCALVSNERLFDRYGIERVW